MALVASSTAATVWLWRERPSRAGAGAVLGGAQLLLVEVLAARLIEPIDVPVAPFVDEYLAGMPFPVRRDFVKLLAYVEHVAPRLAGHWGPFSRLAAGAQRSLLANLESSELALVRAGFQGLKGLCFMATYGRADQWAAIGYDGPAVQWPQGTRS